jgi:hypothetical protein
MEPMLWLEEADCTSEQVETWMNGFTMGAYTAVLAVVHSPENGFIALLLDRGDRKGEGWLLREIVD